jgi:[ribosomal protein S18]-alanine N-acetyltransferase
MSPNQERGIVITGMLEEHVPAVFLLDKASFSLPWTERSYSFEITKNETSIHLVALDTTSESSGKLAGFIVAWAIEDEAHIGTIAVADGYRRKGVAQLLISAALNEAAKRGAEKVFLEVREGNLPAHNLYLKLGFIDFDLRKKYYVDNQEDAIIMLLDPLKVEMG